MDELMRVARKELASFFASPVAYIFLGAFLLVTLFVFFWVDTFFARNIADVRPLFEWMPVLLIFLVAALTMRMWSEERRAGTLEMLMTLPVSPLKLVFGKFLACLGLVGIALALTLPLPLTVWLLGPLDWGPVIGAYLATLFLAAAYIAIGLWVSARSENQIVSLIGTALIGGLFYLLGSTTLTSLFGHQGGEILKLLGAGSRFESITRGVIDLRDLYYYLSIVGIFLTLNIFTLERLRWATDTAQPRRHTQWKLATGLFIANFIAGNLWLHSVGWLRADVTEGNIYSISDATRGYLDRLQEPLLIRGYFSAQTHPLLQPLVPQIRDLLREYEVAGRGKVRVEFVDPLEDPEIEREAGEKYGIKPVAFQTASKYQAAVVNSYFDVMVQYGDQHEVLSYRDLIEVKAGGDDGMELDVRLRNPEYDITRTIKKALYAFQGGGDLFANLHQPVTFRGFISDRAKLPDPLPKLREDLEAVLDEMKQTAGDKLLVDIKDPEAGDGALAKQIAEEYGFRPLALGLLDPDSFYFYMLLESGNQQVAVPIPEGLDQAGLKRGIEAGLKRFASGYLKTIAIVKPQVDPQMARFGLPSGPEYRVLEEQLKENATLKETDLKGGVVPEDADLLMVLAPDQLDDRQLFAIDQFMMQGGTVILAASPFNVNLGGGALTATRRTTGLDEWLAHNGITLEPRFVMDPQNTPFPIPVQRRIGGFTVQEVQSLAYPFFPDIRDDGMDHESGLTAGLGQVTMNWASPITIDGEKNQGRRVIRLLQSSEQTWTTDSTEMQPNLSLYPDLGFPEGDDQGHKLLAAVIEGRFDSYFQGKPSPLQKQEEEKPAEESDTGAKPEGEGEKKAQVAGVIDHSPEGARIILFGSDAFLSDTALSLAMEATRTRYIAPVQLAQNAVDWSLEDRGLLSIRGRGHFSRMLAPLDRDAQVFWEYLNYALALLGLFGLWGLQRHRRNLRLAHYQEIMNLRRADA